MPRILSTLTARLWALLALMLLGCATARPRVVVLDQLVSEELSRKALFLCQYEQVPLPVLSRLPQEARAADYIRSEDLALLQRLPDLDGGPHSREPSRASESERPAQCKVIGVYPSSTAVNVSLLRSVRTATIHYTLTFVQTPEGWKANYRLPESMHMVSTWRTTAEGTPEPEHPESGEETLTFGAGMTRPVKLSGAVPFYTREALEYRVEGLMIIKCILTTRGDVERCRIIKPLPFLNEAALYSLYSNRYKPVTYKGQTVQVDYTFNIQFYLPGSARSPDRGEPPVPHPPPPPSSEAR